MSDAPRWPGANGSPGLDFSRSDAPQPGRTSAPGAPSTDSLDATNAIPKVSVTKPPSLAERVGYGAGSGTGEAAANPSLKSADDWELDSITRQPSPKPGPAYEAKSADVSAPARTAVTPSAIPAAAPAQSAATPSRVAKLDDSSPLPARGMRRTRKARLRLHRIDPWSVMKTAFLFSIAFGVMIVAAVAVLWSVFAGSDAMTYINDFVNRIMADDQGGARFDIANYLGWQRVLGLTTVLAAIDVVIFTAVATLFAFLYNLAAVIMGGLEVTLAED